MKYSLFFILIFILFACMDEPSVKKSTTQTGQQSSPNNKQKELEFELEKKNLENKELGIAKSFLETQKKNSEELIEKLKSEISQAQQKFEEAKNKLDNQLNISKTLQTEKEDLIKNYDTVKESLAQSLETSKDKLQTLLKEKDELLASLKKNLTDLENKYKGADSLALKKEIQEKDDAIKSLTQERNVLKEEVKVLTNKLEETKKLNAPATE